MKRIWHQILRQSLVLAAVVAPTMLSPSQASSPKGGLSKEWTWWVGHQVTQGHRRVPVIGDLTTHLETFYLAKARKKGSGFEVIQTACASKYRPIAGVKIGFHAEHTPSLHYAFTPNGQGALQAHAQIAWNKEDLDQDGQPGLSIDVDAKICRGKLYVSNQTQITSNARWVNPWVWEGTIHTQHSMQILGSDSFCLRTFARNRKEQADGEFRFRALSGPTSCEALLKRPWLVHAQEGWTSPKSSR